MYFWEAQQPYGARVHMVKTDDGITVPTERLLDAIDEQTLLVPISHVIFRSSYINDAKAIIEKAHKVGAYVVLDTFQSLGTVPVDVQALNTDFACGGVLKWLCGGPGVVICTSARTSARNWSPSSPAGSPTRIRWLSKPAPSATPIHRFRFMNGTSHIPSLEAARPGLKIIHRSWCAAHPRKVKTPDRPADRIGRQTRLESKHSPGSRATRRHRFH